MELQGKVALITGAGSGIGKAAAFLLAKEGAVIAALGRTDDELAAVVDQINATGGKAIKLLADISKPDQMENALNDTVQQLGKLDIVFANAGVNGVWAPIEEITPEEWDQTININLRGTFLTVKYAIPYMKSNGGSIIVTSSVNGTRIFSNAGATAYSSTKAAQVAFTQMAALELAKHHIRVNVICPGAIETPINESTKYRNLDEAKERVEFPDGKIPLTDGKPGCSEQVAQLVVFLASDKSSHITGTPIYIDGGESLLMG